VIWAAVICVAIGALAASSNYEDIGAEPLAFTIDVLLGAAVYFAIFLVGRAIVRAVARRRAGGP
jgi:hypothetical protein